MTKESFYFAHEYNPTSDPKIVCLIGNHGGMGYGVYWRIIEMLHQENGNKLPLKSYIIEAIAKQMLANAEQIKNIIDECINQYELFDGDGEFFWSNRVLRNLEKRKEISDIRRESGKKGAIAKQNLANAQQNLANTSKEKESKEKEIKVKENNIKSVEATPQPTKPDKFEIKLNNLLQHNFFEHEDFKDAWDWWQKEKKGAKSTRAKISDLQSLFDLSIADAIKALNKSAGGRYKGLFIEKQNNSKNGQFKSTAQMNLEHSLKVIKELNDVVME